MAGDPSQHGAELAVLLRLVQWALVDLAHDLPAGREAPERLVALAEGLDQVVALLRSRAGIVPGDQSWITGLASR